VKRILALILIVFFAVAGEAFGQTTKEVFKALKRVEARVETGIAYKDYPQVIADAKVDVDAFLASKEAQKNPQFSEHIKKAIDYYLAAGKIWNIEFDSPYNNRLNDIVTENSPLGLIIRKLYPKAPLERTQIGPIYNIPEVLASVWKDASKELNFASKFLKTD